MTKTYIQVLKQIETLQAEAEKLRRKEVADVVSRIREAIDHYGLTAEDLGLGRAAKAPAKKAGKAMGKARGQAAAGKPARAAKYRDDAGHSWGGIGKRPQWLRDALAAGKTLQDFEVAKG
jgi:DNA-binding protein H-NS